MLRRISTASVSIALMSLIAKDLLFFAGVAFILLILLIVVPTENEL